MVDGAGFVAAYEDGIGPVRGRRVLVVGSGGVGAAIAFGLVEAGAGVVDVSDVDDSRARALAERLRAQGVAAQFVEPSAAGYDLVVNASPAGMRPDDPIPIDLAGATSTLTVADVVTKPADTPLLRAAADLGCRVQGGLRMAEAQIPLQARFFGFMTGEWIPSSTGRRGGERRPHVEEMAL
jgi:shikimate dehydrogenase